MRRAVLLNILWACISLPAQETPAPGELMGQPFFIRSQWLVEVGDHQDYLKDFKLERLALDAGAGKLYIAHGPRIEVVDVSSGAHDPAITGLTAARAIALDSTGEFGYVSDPGAGEIAVFDRGPERQIVDTIATCTHPGALALEPQSGLLFVVCGPVANPPRGTGPQPLPQESVSQVSVIDLAQRSERAVLAIEGRLGPAQPDSSGRVYIGLDDGSGLIRIDAVALAKALGVGEDGEAAEEEDESPPAWIWWPNGGPSPAPGWETLSHLPLAGSCRHLSAFAVDDALERVFAACEDRRLLVNNADTGALITSLPIGTETGSVAYDPGRHLIFAAAGGRAGSLTIIHQHVTDSYQVVQELPTLQQAGMLALDPGTGTVYLAAPFLGVSAEHSPARGREDAAGNLMVLAVTQ